MFGLGLGEILLVAVVLLVAVGPERIPGFMREAGKLYGQVRRASDDLRRALVLEADRMDAEERYQKLKERQKAAEEAKKAAQETTGSTAQSASAAAPRVVPATDAAYADPETPAARPAPKPASAAPGPVGTAATDIPEGISADEWSKLPPKVQEMLRSQPAPSAPASQGPKA